MITQSTIKLYGTKVKNNCYPQFSAYNFYKDNFSDNFPEHLKHDVGVCQKILPYNNQDNYNLCDKLIDVKTIILENDYLKAIFLPEYGGRLYSLYDKRYKKELFLKNNNISAHNIGLRNAWFAGGVEWNVGNYGHCYTTYDNVFCAILKNSNKEEFLRIYEFERLKSIFWQIDFHLPKNATELMCHAKLINPFEKPTTVYYWSNVGLPYNQEMRFLFSGTDIIHRGNGKMNYSQLPKANNVRMMENKDITYPKNFNMIFEYYVQNYNATPWQMAIYPNNDIVFEISTECANVKKLFHWGEHAGATTWQDNLAKGTEAKKYIEMQTGIAPSQFHDKIFPANSIFEWSQSFGYISSNNEKLKAEYKIAQMEGHNIIHNAELALLDYEIEMKKCAKQSIEKEDIIHYGSGFGAVEIKRMELDNQNYSLQSMLFPKESITDKEQPWLDLLVNGKLTIPDNLNNITYMISPKWMKYLDNDVKNNTNWYNTLHYGIMAIEAETFEDIFSKTYNVKQRKELYEYAENMLRISEKLKPSVLAKYSLVFVLSKLNNQKEIKNLWEKIIEENDISDDMALRLEYCIFLQKSKQYQRLWDVFVKTKQNNTYYYDRISICGAYAAVVLKKYKFLEQFFSIPHPVIKESETILSDLWFSYQAQLIQQSNESIEMAFNRAVEQNKLPQHLNYRFGGNKKPKFISPI